MNQEKKNLARPKKKFFFFWGEGKGGYSATGGRSDRPRPERVEKLLLRGKREWCCPATTCRERGWYPRTVGRRADAYD